MGKSANLNLKHTPAEKPRTGRCAPKSIYGRKLHELPNTDIIDDWPKNKKRSYNVRIKKGNRYEIVHQAVKKKKKKVVNAPRVTMRRYKDDCRNEA